jgi:threonine dehydrogenase-like Zn-dependent dehydrogenase
MKAVAVFPHERKVDVIDIPEPDGLGPNQVRVRILEVGVCGTDREICAFDYGMPPSGLERLVIGHEALGEVIETGRDVTRVRKGDLVVPTVRRPCPHRTCTACGESRQDFCYTGDFVERGIKMADGYMTEFMVDDERYMNVLPPELRDVGVLVEPLTIAEKALAQIWQVQQRLPWACPVVPGKKAGHCHTAVVLGAGPVGLLGAMALAAANFDVAVYSREPSGGEKAKLVESFGARYVSAAETPVAALPDVLGSIAVVYEAAGASSVAFEMMGVLGVNGIFVFTGVPGRRGPIQVDADVLMRRLVLNNQVVFGTVNASRESFEAAVRDLGDLSTRWPRALRSLISARHPLSAYRDQLLAPPTGIKNVLTLGK